ncbi:hypothetical protein HAX54_019840 [Datura stramonium]|uniref:Helicase C-terminal domain-containing protein n=1 Tax=Datura stramonium TaxID=4076 RepID=A0ABS8URZ9_DATST|nr:hypothetical protein [Datura stramonium]
MNGFPATAIHGDRTQQEREHALRSFKSVSPILVATDLAKCLNTPYYYGGSNMSSGYECFGRYGAAAYGGAGVTSAWD